MINLFKNVDKKLLDIGFIKVSENKFGVRYERKNNEFNYTHRVDIIHKYSGKHILQSYDPELFDMRHIGNTNVGLTAYELKLFYKKMEEIGLYSK